MNRRTTVAVLVLALVASAVLRVRAAELSEIPADEAQRIAERLVKAAQSIQAPQVTIQADPSKASGLSFRKQGILIVPMQGLSPDLETDEVDQPNGKGFAYLFLSEEFVPVVNGTALSSDQVRTVKMEDKKGNRREIKCFLLSGRRLGEDDCYGLHHAFLTIHPSNLQASGTRIDTAQ